MKVLVEDIMADFANFEFLSHNYGTNGKSAIGMWESEQRYLIDLALQSPDASYLEIGSFCGGSACLLATAIKNSGRKHKLYCVDIDFNGFNGAFNYNCFKKGKFNNIIELIETNSLYLAKYLERINNLKIGFLWLDGFHSFKAVVSEFEAVFPYLVNGAIICAHDTQAYNNDDLPDITYRAKSFYHQYMDSEMPDFDGKDLTKFHAMEQKQDFLILEAACYLADKYNLSFIPTPDEYKCDYSVLTGGYKHGGTSPYNSICALQYKA